jgi:hypothetical protein
MVFPTPPQIGISNTETRMISGEILGHTRIMTGNVKDVQTFFAVKKFYRYLIVRYIIISEKNATLTCALMSGRFKFENISPDFSLNFF